MILGLVEHDRGKLNELSLQALTLGRRLADSAGLPLEALLVGVEARPIADLLGRYGVRVTHLAEHEALIDYAPLAWAQSAAEVVSVRSAQIVVAAATDRGSEVMAHLGSRLGLPVAANCVEVGSGEQVQLGEPFEPNEPLRVTRMRWGGSLLEEAVLEGAVKLMTVAPHAVPAEEIPVVPSTGLPEIQVFEPHLTDRELRVRVSGRVPARGDRVSLPEARVVVGGGRGVGSVEGFRALEQLADLLGGAVGVSRAVTSLGWRPHAEQIGQTGLRIAPELYIACGISGAIQHIVGCKSAKRILVINTDADAPIFGRADYAVVGDLQTVIPAISAEIEKRCRGTAQG